MSNQALPLWMQHATGAIPNPTPAEVEADRQREMKAAQDAINGKPDSAETKAMLAALIDHYGANTGTSRNIGKFLKNVYAVLAIIAYLGLFLANMGDLYGAYVGLVQLFAGTGIALLLISVPVRTFRAWLYMTALPFMVLLGGINV